MPVFFLTHNQWRQSTEGKHYILDICSIDVIEILNSVTAHTHTHNRFTAGLEYVRLHPGQQVPER